MKLDIYINIYILKFFIIRLLNYSFLIKFKDHAIVYPTFTNLNYFWSFGFLCLICLSTQILSGFLLSMYYTPSVDLAFSSIEFFMRGYSYSWLIRYTHSNGASLFFIFIIMHIYRGLYYKSYFKPLLWVTGIILWILLMATSFLGYILPWGQMSYWGCMVISSMLTAIPRAGQFLLNWVWGGGSISEITLMRVYSCHFVLPFILLSLSLIHISLLHIEGSSSPLGIENYDYINFYPYFYIKDLFSFIFLFIFIYFYLVFFNPNLLGDALNYVRADYIKTPVHIVPEWYFLPFYCMLRCIPHKVLGILCMGASIFIFFILPIFPTFSIITKFDLIHKFFFIVFVMSTISLSFLAAQHISDYITWYSRFWSIVYFFFFFKCF